MGHQCQHLLYCVKLRKSLPVACDLAARLSVMKLAVASAASVLYCSGQ